MRVPAKLCSQNHSVGLVLVGGADTWNTYPHIERTQETETETQVGRVQIVEVVECIHYFMQRVGKGDNSCCMSMAMDLGVDTLDNHISPLCQFYVLLLKRSVGEHFWLLG